MVGYISDDCYTLKQFSLSPLFWIDRLIKRRFVKRTIDTCSLLYTITDTQKEEYNQIFGNKCKVLFKGGIFDKELQIKKIHNPIKLVYTGNLGLGRWKSLAMIAESLQSLNKHQIIAQLDIYSQTPLSGNMKKSLNIPGTSCFKGSIPATQVKSVQMEADILIHVESFDLSERYKARLSFSTKIVDYFETGKCILAVGWDKTGAIEYLKNNDAALVVTNADEVNKTLQTIFSTPSIIEEYANKGYLCGQKNHRLEEIRKGLYNDLLDITKSTQYK